MITIIFSYDRSIFLNLFLKSLLRCLLAGNLKIVIVYNTSSETFEEGYRIVKERFKTYNNITFIKEELHFFNSSWSELTYKRNFLRLIKHPRHVVGRTDFKKVVTKVIDDSKFKTVVFFTDDSFFYRNVIINEYDLNLIDNNPDILFFSLRHGQNILERPDDLELYSERILVWNRHATNYRFWNYPFSVDGHIYNKNSLLKILKRVSFINPNTLESHLATFVREGNIFTKGLCYFNSSLVNFTVNTVQTAYSTTSHNIDNGKLNNYYLIGYEMKYGFNNQVTQFSPRLDSIILEKNGLEEVISILS